jgi:mono/diheme cytochrome c family protein
MLRLVMAAMAGLLWMAPATAQSTFTPRDESPEEFAEGSGRDQTFYTCTACHGFKLVAQQGMTRAQWDDSISLMIRRHNMPALDDKDRAAVLGYLEAAYPPRAPAAGRGGWQNPFAK